MADDKPIPKAQTSSIEFAGCGNIIAAMIVGFILGFGAFSTYLWWEVLQHCEETCRIYGGVALVLYGAQVGAASAVLASMLGFFVRIPKWLPSIVITAFIGTIIGFGFSFGTQLGTVSLITHTAQGFLIGCAIGSIPHFLRLKRVSHDSQSPHNGFRLL